MTSTPIADAAWIDVTIARLFAPLRQYVGMDNPLATGFHCPTCGTRLDKADRPCPFGPHDEPKPRRRARRTSATRLAILNDSTLIYAVSAA